MHVIADFPGVAFTSPLLDELEKTGVKVIPVEEHTAIKGNHLGRIILGYAHLCPADIEKGLLRLKEALSGSLSASISRSIHPFP